VGHAEIVSMNDQQLRIPRVAESFGDGLHRFLGASRGEQRKERECDHNCSFHGEENSIVISRKIVPCLHPLVD